MRNTPFEQGPTFTASGRQIHKPRAPGGLHTSTTNGYGEGSTDELANGWSGGVGGDGNGEEEEEDEEVVGNGRARRAVARPATNGRGKRKVGEEFDEDDEGMSDDDDLPVSGDEWDSDENGAAGDGDVPDARDEDEDEEMSEGDAAEEEEEEESQSLVVKLRIPFREGIPRSNNGVRKPTSTLPDERPPVSEPLTNSSTTNGLTHPPPPPNLPPTALPTTAAKTSIPSPPTNGLLSAHHAHKSATPHHNKQEGSLLGSTLGMEAEAEAYPTPASTSFPLPAAADAKAGSLVGGGELVGGGG